METATATKLTVQDKFNKYHAENPDVFQMFLHYAHEAKSAGFTTYSAWAIMNRIRWHRDINPKSLQTGEFKISNDYIAWYALRAMADFPLSFKGFFKIKKLSRM